MKIMRGRIGTWTAALLGVAAFVVLVASCGGGGGGGSCQQCSQIFIYNSFGNLTQSPEDCSGIACSQAQCNGQPNGTMTCYDLQYNGFGWLISQMCDKC